MFIVHSGSNVFYLNRAMNAGLGYTPFNDAYAIMIGSTLGKSEDARDAHPPPRLGNPASATASLSSSVPRNNQLAVTCSIKVSVLLKFLWPLDFRTNLRTNHAAKYPFSFWFMLRQRRKLRSFFVSVKNVNILLQKPLCNFKLRYCIARYLPLNSIDRAKIPLENLARRAPLRGEITVIMRHLVRLMSYLMVLILIFACW